jgi:superfamily II DNA or RNA helicase
LVDGRRRELFRLVSEAKRISLAHLFDPFLAAQTSNLDPLPHQIEAVYDKMLPRQPLRFLLADDPGAGKTIMAGLFCEELMIRGDVERCLVIAPGSLVEQWQDELWQKFALRSGPAQAPAQPRAGIPRSPSVLPLRCAQAAIWRHADPRACWSR